MYKEYDDNELLYLIAEQNEDATNILYEKYKTIVAIKVKKYLRYANKIGLEYSDLYQEGMVGLSEAIEGFKESKETKFSTFANLCIERQIFSVLTKSSRKKHNILNESLSLDNTYEDNLSLLNFVFDKSSDPGIYIENKERVEELYKKIVNNLTDLENEVFKLKINGFDYKEICEMLNKSYKSVDTALQRVKNKIKKILETV
ncbi:MAG: sigma-70 family RNA polymerase sigma factor [Bacilli bacterium]|nr:sigma-70 family RNA polymerase sigma factor [Bacilli bacterium]